MLNYQRVNAKKMEIVGLAELAGRCNQDSEDRQAAEELHEQMEKDAAKAPELLWTVWA